MNKLPQEIVDQIVKQLSELRFGELTVVVHDGKVMQIEVKQKIRLPR
ncbi:MAG: YezD family protein [Candidatus Spyradosoma sp.]